MSFDTLIMAAVTAELRQELIGAPVQRIYEPDRNLIIIHLYTEGRQRGLLFSFDSQHARVHLTDKRYRNVIQPSPFCMLLRKYLIGARMAGLTMPPLERILKVDFDPADGMPAVKLIAEIMGRRSNLILTDKREIILGAAKIATLEKNPLRAVYPGEKYHPVPSQNKLDPLEMDFQSFRRGLQSFTSKGDISDQALVKLVSGLSPLIAREALYRSKNENEEKQLKEIALFRVINSLFSQYGSGEAEPVMLPGSGIYAAIPLTHLETDPQVRFNSVNKMLDQVYDELLRSQKTNRLRRKLLNSVEKRLNSLYKKKGEQEKELQEAEGASQHRLFGELLLAYGNQIQKGAECAVLPHLYKPEEKVKVPLDPSKSAGANAQRHFNRYQKAKSGLIKIRRQLKMTASEIEYCQGLKYSIENSSEKDLEDTLDEMIEAGYLRYKKQQKGKNITRPEPLILKTSAGHTMLIGKNNRQNDYITFKAAVRRDTWLHVRQLPGSHVILKEVPYPPPPEDLEEAAFIAAYFSKGKFNKAVEVDYTEVRHVRRRPGGRPGFVLYENFKTITVNPLDEKMIERFCLKKQ